MKIFYKCLVVTVIFLVSGLPAANAANPPDSVAEFPIRTIDNRTHILFDGPNGPVVFLLDTGATTTVIFDRTIVPEGALTESDEAQILFPAINRSVTGKRIGKLTLTAGGSHFISQNGLLLEHATGIQDELEAEFSGIIGQEMFRRYVVEIDPQNEILRLHPLGTDLEDLFEIEHILQIRDRTAYITFRSQMPWEKYMTRKNMLLDSGYPGGMVFWSRKHFMQTTSLTERKMLTEKNMGVLTAANVSFGSLYFENLPIFIASSVPQQSTGRDGLIGASILSQYHHVIDFGGKRLLLTPIVDENGDPVQMIDGAVYTPNNEDYLVKFFGPKIPIYPVLTLFSDKSRNFSPHTGGSSDHN